MTRKTALAFLAHPDDAEILCAGTIIRLAATGWEIHIATATAGDCGTTIHPPDVISEIRLKEARRSADLIGAHYHCLGEKDGLVVFDRGTILKAAELFRSVSPRLVFTHARSDYMMDHEMVSLLARSASFMYAAPNFVPGKLQPGTGVPYLYYCDPIEGIDPLGQPVNPTTYVDVSSQMEMKVAMLSCHASQREWLRAHHGMDEYLNSMRQHSAARGSEIGVDAAEAFVQHRGHAYPSDDLLVELFG